MELYSTNPGGILKPHQGIGKPTRHKRLSDAGSTLKDQILFVRPDPRIRSNWFRDMKSPSSP
jgi:hypothetical protein